MLKLLCGLAFSLAVPAWALGLMRIDAEATVPGASRAAFSTAVEQAKAAAVAEAVQSVLPTRDLSLARPVLAQAPGYVSAWRLLERTLAEDSLHVRIEAHIDWLRLRRDLAKEILPALRKPPVVAVLVAGELQGLPDEGAPVAETILCNALGETKVELLPRGHIREGFAPEVLTEIARTSDADAAAQLGRKCLADVVVFGAAAGSPASAGGPGEPVRYQVQLTLRVVRSRDAGVLDELRADAEVGALLPEDAAAQALRDASAKLRDDIVVAAVLGGMGERRVAPGVIVTIEDLTSREGVEEVLAFLKGAPGIEAVEELSPVDGNVRLRIACEMPVGNLVKLLTGQFYTRFRLEPRAVVGHEMTLRALPEP